MSIMLQKGSFLNEWLYPTFEQQNTIEWRISEEAQSHILSLTPEHDFVAMQRQGVLGMLPYLGSTPVVALSGGIDSQAACLLLRNAGIEFSAVTMEFPDGLNEHDVTSAQAFCDKFGIRLQRIQFDIVNYLTRDLRKQVVKYDCPSPQLTAHCAFYDLLLKTISPSAIICGGNPPGLRGDKWEFISNRSHSVWMTFAKMNNYPLIGNFLGFSLEIALPFMCLQPNMDSTDLNKRYEAKITGMKRLGLDVIPQAQKFTGFERVKEHFEKLTKDGWFFEKAFRLPNHVATPEYASILELPANVATHLTNLHSKLNS